MPIGASAHGIIAAGGASGTPELTFLYNEIHDVTGGSVDPWDASIDIPAGSGRVVLDMAAFSGAASAGNILDPGGLGAALTKLFTTSTGNENLEVHRGLNGILPATATGMTLRHDHQAAEQGRRRVMVFGGARQEVQFVQPGPGGSQHTIELNAPAYAGGGDWPVNTYMHAMLVGQSNALSWAVADDLTLIRETTLVTTVNRFVEASGVLTAPKASPRVTFSTGGAQDSRPEAFMVLIAPA